MRIAIPSANPGGLNAELSPHFGHCDAFTLVDLRGTDVQQVTVLPNRPHEAGACMAPVMLLKKAGADAIMAGGMGMRPLCGFQEVGIDVFFSEGAATVAQAVNLLRQGRVRRFGPPQACAGGGAHR